MCPDEEKVRNTEIETYTLFSLNEQYHYTQSLNVLQLMLHLLSVVLPKNDSLMLQKSHIYRNFMHLFLNFLCQRVYIKFYIHLLQVQCKSLQVVDIGHHQFLDPRVLHLEQTMILEPYNRKKLQSYESISLTLTTTSFLSPLSLAL